MTQTNYSPYSQERSSQGSPKTKPPKKQSSSDHRANLIPAYFFWVVLLVSSIGINIYNVYSRFAAETIARFTASGVYDFIFSLTVFGFIAFAVRVGGLVLTIYVVRIMSKTRQWMHPVWLLILFCAAFVTVVGLQELMLNIPFVVALSIVGMIQYLEILFWNAKRKSTILWIVVVAAYIVEAWMQYDMLPFHYDYETAWGLLTAMADASVSWDGFQPVQALLAMVGIFGIEAGDRMIKLVKKHG